MSEDVVTGSVDRRHFDLYRIEGADFVAAVLVDWNTGEVRQASPMVRQWVGTPIGSLQLKAQDRGWEVRLIPHIGYEESYTETFNLLNKARWK